MKRLRYRDGGIDATDIAILRALSEDARVTMADLARAVGLSAPSVTERVRRLEEAGIVRGYGARIDPAALGLPVAAYIRVRPMPGQLRKVADVLAGLEAVVECDRVTGEDCFIAKVHLRSVEVLEAVIDEIMPYAMTNTSVIQSSAVKRRLPPLSSSAAWATRRLRANTTAERPR
ncbi:MAG: Lrp/AsnC family transcriptional regulator [Candidatus Rokubacteria bacterium]|nr:Lrp/AsnC family transcriptional regulator [Candidatus Rokubacteria bacterium]